MPILRMIPIQQETGSLEHTMFALQHYVSVNSRRIREFKITMKERLDGEPIRIRGGVALTLHFRQVE